MSAKSITSQERIEIFGSATSNDPPFVTGTERYEASVDTMELMEGALDPSEQSGASGSNNNNGSLPVMTIASGGVCSSSFRNQVSSAFDPSRDQKEKEKAKKSMEFFAPKANRLSGASVGTAASAASAFSSGERRAGKKEKRPKDEKQKEKDGRSRIMEYFMDDENDPKQSKKKDNNTKSIKTKKDFNKKVIDNEQLLEESGKLSKEIDNKTSSSTLVQPFGSSSKTNGTSTRLGTAASSSDLEDGYGGPPMPPPPSGGLSRSPAIPPPTQPPGAYRHGPTPSFAERAARAAAAGGGTSTNTIQVGGVSTSPLPQHDIVQQQSTSQLPAAEPVDAEAIMYAEDVKEDEIVEARRKFYCYAIVGAFVALLIIIPLSIGMAVSTNNNNAPPAVNSTDPCDLLDVDDQTISQYCKCHNGNAEGYLLYFNQTQDDETGLQNVDDSLFLRYEALLLELQQKEWIRNRKGNDAVDLSLSSCQTESMVLQTMAIVTRGVPFQTFERELLLAAHRIDQMFALIALYFDTNGDDWIGKENWLDDPNMCSWEGLSCDFPATVSDIELIGNNLQGTLPAYLSVGDSIKEIDLSRNPKLSGSFPTDLGQLTDLIELNLRGANLTGTIPSHIGLMESLQFLDLSNNTLTGTLPTGLKGASKLLSLRLEFNQLTGTIPSFDESLFGHQMNIFSVRYNNLSGTIPDSLLELSTLDYVDLSFNNFQGQPPEFSSAVLKLDTVNLIESGFQGNLPDSYCLSERVQVFANCSTELMVISTCDCCPTNSSRVLKCVKDLDAATLQYVLGVN